jgi:transmembrane sensor
MDNHSSNARQDPVAQASEFFVEFRAGDGTPAVRARFEQWLRRSPENVQAYLEIAAGWSQLPTADPEDRLDLQALLAAARNASDDKVIHLDLGRTHGAPRFLPHRMRLWALAGSLALLLVALAGTGIWVFTQGGLTYKTGIGEQRTLILADGSTVILNALTTVRVHMTQDAREVTLVRGQAYFHDADEPARPFIVRAGRSAVRAIGTEFDVDNEPDRTVVTVLEGQVAVAKSFAWADGTERREILRELAGPPTKLKAVLVSAGEQVTLLAQNIPAPTPVDVTAVTAWMQQRLIFDDTPLEKVAEEFNLYSKRRLVIEDPSLQSVGVSGVYSASDPAALIGFLRSQPTLKVVETDGEFLVTRQ